MTLFSFRHFSLQLGDLGQAVQLAGQESWAGKLGKRPFKGATADSPFSLSSPPSLSLSLSTTPTPSKIPESQAPI